MWKTSESVHKVLLVSFLQLVPRVKVTPAHNMDIWCNSNNQRDLTISVKTAQEVEAPAQDPKCEVDISFLKVGLLVMVANIIIKAIRICHQ